MSKITDSAVFFAFSFCPGEITTACVQWFPGFGDSVPDCDDADVYDALKAAAADAPAGSLYDRLESVAARFGGEFVIIDDFELINKP